jgi:hypothetical protein
MLFNPVSSKIQLNKQTVVVGTVYQLGARFFGCPFGSVKGKVKFIEGLFKLFVDYELKLFVEFFVQLGQWLVCKGPIGKFNNF